MRNDYGVSAWSLAVDSFKKILAWATLIGASAYGLLLLLIPSPAAAQPEAAATGTGAAETLAAPSPWSLELRLLVLVALAVVFVLYLVVRRILAPIARGEFPFGPSHPGL